MAYATKPIIRCSSLDRLLSCSGSFTLEALLADVIDLFATEVEGDAMTWRGNWCHHQAAKRLVMDHGAVAPDGLPKPALPKTFEPSPWDERTVEWYIANLLEAKPIDHAIFVERHITLEFPRFILSGHIDEYSVNAAVTDFELNDLKSGINEVDVADENWQLAGYACLLKKEHPTLQRGSARIYQPSAQTPISEAPVDNLDSLVAFMEGKINKALDALYTFTTGYKQCRLCTAVELPCPALKKEIEAMQLTLAPDEVKALIVTSDLKQLAETAAKGRAIAGPIKRLLDALKERIIAHGPLTMPDGTIVSVAEEPGDRKITHTKVAFAFVEQKLGEDQAWETLELSLTKTEDLLVDSGLKRTSEKEESAQSWIKDNLSHLIHRGTKRTLKFT